MAEIKTTRGRRRCTMSRIYLPISGYCCTRGAQGYVCLPISGQINSVFGCTVAAQGLPQGPNPKSQDNFPHTAAHSRTGPQDNRFKAFMAKCPGEPPAGGVAAVAQKR